MNITAALKRKRQPVAKPERKIKLTACSGCGELWTTSSGNCPSCDDEIWKRRARGAG
jgi:hypothetical protein